MDVLDGLPQLLAQVSTGNGLHRHLLLAILRVLIRKSAQHHFGMLDEVIVDMIPLRGLADRHPIGLLDGSALPLLEEQYVRHDTCAGVALEGISRQPDRAQQVGPGSHILPHGVRLFVHRATGGHDGHHAARTHQVDGPCDEVVVNQEVIAVILLVHHLERTEGHVADHHVEEIVREGGLLKALHGYGVLLVELLGDPAGDAVQLHAVHPGDAHALRQHTHEVAHAATRLQDVALPEAHAVQGVIHGTDDRGRRVKGVECGSPRRLVFLRGERRLDLRVFARPLAGIRVERLGDAAPADEAREDFLFLRRRQPVFVLQRFQQIDGVHVGSELRLRPARAEIIVGDAEVVALDRRLRRRLAFFPRSEIDDDLLHLHRRVRCVLPGLRRVPDPLQDNIVILGAKDGKTVLLLEGQVFQPHLMVEDVDGFDFKPMSVHIECHAHLQIVRRNIRSIYIRVFRHIILCTKMLDLLAAAILRDARQVEALALLPEHTGVGLPPIRGKTRRLYRALRGFTLDKPGTAYLRDTHGVISVEFKEAVALKADERIVILFFERIVLGIFLVGQAARIIGNGCAYLHSYFRFSIHIMHRFLNFFLRLIFIHFLLALVGLLQQAEHGHLLILRGRFLFPRRLREYGVGAVDVIMHLEQYLSTLLIMLIFSGQRRHRVVHLIGQLHGGIGHHQGICEGLPVLDGNQVSAGRTRNILRHVVIEAADAPCHDLALIPWHLRVIRCRQVAVIPHEIVDPLCHLRP